MLCAYGKYIDNMILLKAKHGDYEGMQFLKTDWTQEICLPMPTTLGVRGASGIWRIKDRTVTFTQRIGDEKIMKEH
jgi:hypothetical protein